MWEFGIGIGLWLLLFLGLPAVWAPEPGTTAALAAALLPAAPLVWAAVAIARHVRRADEMQRQALLQSFGIGFGGSMVVAVALAPLEGMGFAVPVPSMWVFLAGMIAWSLALMVLLGRASR